MEYLICSEIQLDLKTWNICSELANVRMWGYAPNQVRRLNGRTESALAPNAVSFVNGYRTRLRPEPGSPS